MSLPTDGQFARNLIGGRWQFPGTPFDYEVRSPHASPAQCGRTAEPAPAVRARGDRGALVDAIRAGLDSCRTAPLPA